MGKLDSLWVHVWAGGTNAQSLEMENSRAAHLFSSEE